MNIGERYLIEEANILIDKKDKNKHRIEEIKVVEITKDGAYIKIQYTPFVSINSEFSNCIWIEPTKLHIIESLDL